MTVRYLCLFELEDQKRIALLNEPTPLFNNHPPSPYRISPIFPVSPKVVELPKFQGKSLVGFFFFEKAFSVIGHLLETMDKSVSCQLWFSHGLASIILFSDALEKFEDIKKLAGLRGSEIWILEDDYCRTSMTWCCKPATYDPKSFEITKPTALPFDLQTTVHEFTNSLNTGIVKAAQYVPAHLVIYERLAKIVNEILAELISLYSQDAIPPASLDVKLETINEDPKNKQEMINQRTGHLVQINSVLSYVLSQCFSGAVPISENVCHIRNFSLLGIGTAFLALASFGRFIERVFDGIPICQAINTVYELRPGFNICTDVNTFDPNEWAESCHIDNYFEPDPNKEGAARIRLDAQKGAARGKLDLSNEGAARLVCYSGRQGFRETEFSVTSAIQVLHLADTARWSFMTISHELLHAQVRALLAAIFDSRDSLPPWQLFHKYYMQFATRFRISTPKNMGTLRGSLRDILLNYTQSVVQIKATICETYGQLFSEGSIKREKKLFDEPFLWGYFRKEYSFINDVMVHVLDYSYFYNENPDLYLSLLWESWTPVPVVLERLEIYLLRSILAIGSKQVGSIRERYHASLDIVNSSLKRLLDRTPDNLVIIEALRALADKKLRDRLMLEFDNGIYLAEMVTKYLQTSYIHAALMKDELLAEPPADGTYPYTYPFDVGDFPETNIESPVAFIADRLQRALSRENNRSPEEEFYASAWVLLACASSLPGEGE